MCRVNTFLVFPDQMHSGQLKPSREDDAGALETEVEGKGSVADPAKLTFVSLEHLEKIILPKKVNSLFVEFFHMVCKVLLVDKGLLALDKIRLFLIFFFKIDGVDLKRIRDTFN